MFTTKLKYEKYSPEYEDRDCHERRRALDDENVPQIMITKKRTTERPIVLPRKLDVIPISHISKRLLLLQRSVSSVYSIRNSFGVNTGKRKDDHRFYIHMYTELNIESENDFDFRDDDNEFFEPF